MSPRLVLLAALVVSTGACRTEEASSEDGVPLPSSAQVPEDDVGPAPTGSEAEDAPSPEMTSEGSDPFPSIRSIASRAEGLPAAELSLADPSCVPGECVCHGGFPEEWRVDDWAGLDNPYLEEGATCVAADFDGDDDWDAVILGGEGTGAAIVMERGEPDRFLLLDLLGWPEVVGPGSVPGSDLTVTRHSILVPRGRESVLFEWADGTFTLRSWDTP